MGPRVKLYYYTSQAHMILLVSRISLISSVQQYCVRSCDPLVTSLNKISYLSDIHIVLHNAVIYLPYLLLISFLIMSWNFVPSLATMPTKYCKKYHKAFIIVTWPQCSSNGIGALYTSSMIRKVLESLYIIITHANNT